MTRLHSLNSMSHRCNASETRELIFFCSYAKAIWLTSILDPNFPVDEHGWEPIITMVGIELYKVYVLSTLNF